MLKCYWVNCMNNIRVVFMGTSEFAKEILKSIIDKVDVALVVSQPDSLVGRKQVLTPSPVKTFATLNNIEVFTPQNIKTDFSKIEEVQPDLIVTCAYGQIIPKTLLDLPKLGCINVHASLLPKLRGGAPIHRAIMDGLEETGITIMYMDEHMDTGDVIDKDTVKIDLDDNLDSLTQKLIVCAKALLIKTLPTLIDGTSKRTKQSDSDATYANIIKKEDELIDFSRKTREVYDKIRALDPVPGAYFTMNGEVVKVYSSEMGLGKGTPGEIINIYKDGFGIATQDGEIIVKEIKLAGKNRIKVRDYLNGIKRDNLLGVVCNEK